MTFLCSAFYALTPLDAAQQAEILETLRGWPAPEVNGMVIVAPDGLNATVAGSSATVKAVEDWLAQRLPLSERKHSLSPVRPFRRWKVVQRRETVTSGRLTENPAAADATHLSPREFHQLLEQGEVTLLDVRNDYEVRVGSFRGALDPKTRKFTDLLDYLESHPPPKDRPLLTFCTGGIRCEKAVPYLRSLGYAQVFQLSGGILNYLAQMGPGFFEGECFVFDDRVALDGELQPTRRFVRCQQCGQPYARDGQCPDGHA